MEKQAEEEGGAPRLVPGKHLWPLPPLEGQRALGLPGRGGWAGHPCSRQSQPPLPDIRNFNKRRNVRPDSDTLPASRVDWEHLLEKPHTAADSLGSASASAWHWLGGSPDAEESWSSSYCRGAGRAASTPLARRCWSTLLTRGLTSPPPLAACMASRNCLQSLEEVREMRDRGRKANKICA